MTIRPSHISMLCLCIVLAPHLQGTALLLAAGFIGVGWLLDALHERKVMRLTALIIEQREASKTSTPSN